MFRLLRCISNMFAEFEMREGTVIGEVESLGFLKTLAKRGHDRRCFSRERVVTAKQKIQPRLCNREGHGKGFQFIDGFQCPFLIISLVYRILFHASQENLRYSGVGTQYIISRWLGNRDHFGNFLCFDNRLLKLILPEQSAS